ncbi:hypothetical protein [Leifsonia poae]|uniref:Uncharacterized protein n=1 Tax=Leifsonia poae TaxID=110933 RepID=A0A9W6LZC0_9MICO|nr:hypothetical protein [Leifsonia poae]GLJ75482.1 hypothetical protein GCM10017584_10560 [Leifsonia poae]
MTIDELGRAGSGSGGGLIGGALIEDAAERMARDCPRDPDAVHDALRERVIDKLHDTSRLAEVVDLRASSFVPCPGASASAMSLRHLRGPIPTVAVQLYALANADGPTPCQLLGWALTLFGSDWFYGAYVLDTEDEGLQSIVVYLNHRLQPIIPAQSIRENCEPVAHLLA